MHLILMVTSLNSKTKESNLQIQDGINLNQLINLKGAGSSLLP